MSQSVNDELPINRSHEIRDTVLKSGFTGVAATVLVVAMCSPAGLGGLIGTSVASGLGFGSTPTSDHNTLNFPQAPQPLTTAELQSIHERLDSSIATLDDVRAATDAEINFMRSVASGDHIVAFNEPVEAPSAVSAPSDPNLELAALLLPESQAQ